MRLGRFRSDLAGAHSLDEALDSLASLLTSAGFSSVDYGHVSVARAPGHRLHPLTLHYRHIPSGFSGRWKHFANCDPLYLAGLKSTVPLDSIRLRRERRWDRRCRKAWEELDKAGLARAILIPLHLPGGGYSTIAAYWGDAIGDEDWHSLFAKHRDLVFVAAHEFQDAVSQHHLFCDESGVEIQLTERERECLELAAEGQTTDEIADFLALTPHTVRFHLGNAFRKLDAVNRAEAVARAMKRGLLS